MERLWKIPHEREPELEGIGIPKLAIPIMQILKKTKSKDHYGTALRLTLAGEIVEGLACIRHGRKLEDMNLTGLSVNLYLSCRCAGSPVIESAKRLVYGRSVTIRAYSFEPHSPFENSDDVGE